MKKFEKEAYGYIKDMFDKHNMVKRVVLTIISIITMGFGISLFSISGFGVDPFTSMNMNISSTLGMSYGTYQLIVNAAIILFVVIFAHRGWIGIGTLINMVGVGYSCEFFSKLVGSAVMPVAKVLAVKIAFLGCGIIVLCFACSLFFVSNIGVGPYDSLGFMISQSIKVPYKWVRVGTDVVVILIGLVVSGGFGALLKGDFSKIQNIGIGTIITAFMMGPLVNFFSEKVSSKILNVDYASISKDVAFFMIKGAMVRNGVPSDTTSSKLNLDSGKFEFVNRGNFKVEVSQEKA